MDITGSRSRGHRAIKMEPGRMVMMEYVFMEEVSIGIQHPSNLLNPVENIFQIQPLNLLRNA
jgi:hypothetical protein